MYLLIHREDCQGVGESREYLFDTYDKAVGMVANILTNYENYQVEKKDGKVMWHYYTSLYNTKIHNWKVSKVGFYGTFEIKELLINPSEPGDLFLNMRF